MFENVSNDACRIMKEYSYLKMKLLAFQCICTG